VTAPFDFVPIWTLILGFGVFSYVLLDGFDLGVGMLFGLAPDTASRNLIMNAIAPIWDGNETWLVLGGLGLLAAFPLAYSIIIPAVYFPIIIMLLAMVFRGVAFEFRFSDAEHKGMWDHGFAYGSTVATFSQGIVLGAFIQGFSWPDVAFLSPVPIAAGLLALYEWRALGGPADAGPFAGAVGLFLISYLGIAISLWPMIVPHHYTLWQAASSVSTQAFLVVGTVFLLPIILMYTGWSYWVFRGKVRGDMGYH
jgi:cytochrome bd-type quinol oxidase subunit 2